MPDEISAEYIVAYPVTCSSSMTFLWTPDPNCAPSRESTLTDEEAHDARD